MKTKLPDSVWSFIKRWEGGSSFTNDKDDTGGATRYGISKNNNPDIDVKNLTEQGAKQIMRNRYWLMSHAHDIPDYMQLIQMNCAVNCGNRAAIKILQKTIGTKADGLFGNKSYQAAQGYKKGARQFAITYLAFQAMYYFNIVERRKSQHKWLKGWIRRTLDAAWQTAVSYGRSNHA